MHRNLIHEIYNVKEVVVQEVRVDQMGHQGVQEVQAVQVDQVMPTEAQEVKAEAVRGDQVEEVAQ